MPEPTTSKIVIDAIGDVWTRGALFLWAIFTAATGALILLGVFAGFHVGDAQEKLSAYGTTLAVVAVVTLILAIFKTVAEFKARRSIRITYQLGKRQIHAENGWGQAKVSGETGRKLAGGDKVIIMQHSVTVSNLSPEDVRIVDSELQFSGSDRMIHPIELFFENPDTAKDGARLSNDHVLRAKETRKLTVTAYVPVGTFKDGQNIATTLTLIDQSLYKHKLRKFVFRPVGEWSMTYSPH